MRHFNRSGFVKVKADITRYTVISLIECGSNDYTPHSSNYILRIEVRTGFEFKPNTDEWNGDDLSQKHNEILSRAERYQNLYSESMSARNLTKIWQVRTK